MINQIYILLRIFDNVLGNFQYHSWIKEAHPQFYDEFALYPTILYYMNKEQEQKIMELDIKLPFGYHFSEVDFETDPDIINSSWIHARKGDDELTR